jgi:hypothetical protein
MKATTGTEWRKAREQGEAVELPSKHVVVLRPISMQSLLRHGRIPDSLTGLVSSFISGQGLDKENPVALAKSITELNMVMCKSAMLTPRIVDDPKTDEEISFEDLSEEEIDFIVSWAQEPVKTMEKFREKQAAVVENVLSGGDVSPTA